MSKFFESCKDFGKNLAAVAEEAGAAAAEMESEQFGSRFQI